MAPKSFIVAIVLFAGILVGAIVYARLPKTEVKTGEFPTVQNISPQEFDQALQDRDPFIVDVHIPQQVHLEGTDAFIPYDEVESRIAEFPADRNSEIILYCRTGSMSQTAGQALVAAGYTDVKNLIGGVEAYRESHQEVTLVPQNQDLGTVIYGDVTQTVVTLRNNTKKPLQIIKVSTSCSCTKATVEKTELAPYTGTEVYVSFDPAVHKDDTDIGELTRVIFIETDNINFSKIHASITANVIKKP